jgi:MoaA/NifB/PqqE/SkfB family radical SAM enzyme
LVVWQTHHATMMIRKNLKKAQRHWHVTKILAKGLWSTRNPLLAHVIPVRRCNLSCAYCNEYDDNSKPVPLEVMRRRIDKLAELGTLMIIISGGEPLLHPDLEKIVVRIRSHGMICGLISNGYLMTPQRIVSLNKAGLEFMQLSIDNVNPDDVSKKSLKVLDSKLVDLYRYAEFGVNINSVIGGGIANPEDALVIARRAVQFGFTTSLGVIHDGSGSLKPLNAVERKVYLAMKKIGKKSYARIHKFQDNLSLGLPNNWRCRAGSRYLYICEDGLVHYCSQQRGYPAIPLERYTIEDLRREYFTKKACAPYCTVACVHQIATFDNWRDPQAIEPVGSVQPHPASPQPEPLESINEALQA